MKARRVKFGIWYHGIEFFIPIGHVSPFDQRRLLFRNSN